MCLGAGRWTIARGTAPHNVHAGISTHSARITITGNGPGTVLEVVGDLGKSELSVVPIMSSALSRRIDHFV